MCQALWTFTHVSSCMSHTIPVILTSFCGKESWGSEVTNSLPKSTWEGARIYDYEACYTY